VTRHFRAWIPRAWIPWGGWPRGRWPRGGSPQGGCCPPAPTGRPASFVLGFLVVLAAQGVTPSEASGQWVNAPGAGWADLTVYAQDTRQTYQFDGVKRPIFADGRARTVSAFFTASVGLLRGLDGWVQLPFHRLQFEDAADLRESTGFGDPRLYLRIDPTLLGGAAIPVALRGGVKLDGGDFDVDAEVIPLGEGQRDWELMVEVGRSFHPRPLWAAGWVGHRWREDNQEAARNPGNEWFWLANVGGSVGILHWQVGAEGIRGDPWIIQGIRLRSARREVLQVSPSLGTDLGAGQLRVGTRTTLEGRNLPAGTAVFAGYFRGFSFR